VACDEHRRLLDEYGATVQELLMLHEVQFVAVVRGDTDSSRFDLLIHMANEKKHLAKNTYIRHLESHGCAIFDGINET
jgi:tRNA splicing endonuclease